jgi:hypothetical protein
MALLHVGFAMPCLEIDSNVDNNVVAMNLTILVVFAMYTHAKIKDQ